MSKITIYNAGFFGCWRETGSSISGHYQILYSKTEFAIEKINDYGGFTYLGGEIIVEDLDLPSYRQLHDILLSEIDLDDADENVDFGRLKTYPLKGSRISANIGYGDRVVDLRNNKDAVIDSNWDLELVNRNFFYKLVDRDLHPEPMSKIDFMKLHKEAFDTAFSSWVEEDFPKKASKNSDTAWLRPGFKVEYPWGKVTYTVCVNARGNTWKYYIKVTDSSGVYKSYSKKSAVSAPFYDLKEILIGELGRHPDYSTYQSISLYRVESELNDYGKPETNTTLFEDEYSYVYNTRATHF